MKITTIQKILDTSVEIAAPATPILSPNISIALPVTLIRLEIIETTIGYLELPHDLKIAEPALNKARNG